MKCAGSSVEYTLLQNCGEEALCTGGIGEEEISRGYVDRNNSYYESGHLMFRFHSHTWPGLFFERIADASAWKDYKRITIVRNPWDSLVSYYWWAVSNKPVGKWFKITEEDSLSEIKFKFQNFMSFIGKTESVRQRPTYVYEAPMDYFSRVNEEFVSDNIDFYLSFETIQEDFDTLSENLSLPKQELARFKTKFRKIKIPYSAYYNDTTRKAVEMRFPKTIEKFGYKFS